jgi:hypothetical protein
VVRGVKQLLGHIVAGFGEMAHPLRMKRRLAVAVMKAIKAACDAKEGRRGGSSRVLKPHKRSVEMADTTTGPLPTWGMGCYV